MNFILVFRRVNKTFVRDIVKLTYLRPNNKMFYSGKSVCACKLATELSLITTEFQFCSARSTTVLPRRFFCADNSSIAEKIRTLIGKNKVVVFMKGIPDAPKCGFSNAVAQILRMHGVQYDSYDVLEDDRLRQGIKKYSNWPTIPQVFINGEFIGGCDLLLQMHQSGDLVEELQKVGIHSALLSKEQKK